MILQSATIWSRNGRLIRQKHCSSDTWPLGIDSSPPFYQLIPLEPSDSSEWLKKYHQTDLPAKWEILKTLKISSKGMSCCKW